MYNSFLFSQHESVYATQQNYTFTQMFARSNMKSMSLSIQGVQHWNSLDSSQFFSECSSRQNKIIKLNFEKLLSDMKKYWG